MHELKRHGGYRSQRMRRTRSGPAIRSARTLASHRRPRTVQPLDGSFEPAEQDSRTDRQIRERPNISALSRQFNVARRTIIRDLQELIRRGQLKPEVYPEVEEEAED